MQLIDILAKDFLAFFRDIRSFALLFLAPIMLVLIVGLSFLSVTPSNVKVVACSLGNEEVDTYIDTSIKNTKIFLLDRIDSKSVDECKERIDQKIIFDSYRAGIIIPENKEDQTTELILIVDNSKLVSEFIKSYFKILTDDLSQKITKGYVNILFDNIEEVKKDIDDIETKLRDQQFRLDRIRSNLNSIKSALASASSEMKSSNATIRSASNTLDSTIGDVNSINSSIAISLSRIDSSISAVSASNASSTEKSNIIQNITLAKSSLESTTSLLSDVKNSLMNSKSALNNARNQLDTSELDSAISSIQISITSLDISLSEIDYALDKLSVFKNLIQKTDVEKPETIQFVDAKLQNFFGNRTYIDFLFPSTVLMIIMIILLSINNYIMV